MFRANCTYINSTIIDLHFIDYHTLGHHWATNNIHKECAPLDASLSSSIIKCTVLRVTLYQGLLLLEERDLLRNVYYCYRYFSLIKYRVFECVPLYEETIYSFAYIGFKNKTT